MIYKKFSYSLTAKKFLLAVFLMPLSLFGQSLDFDLFQGEAKIENFEVLSYKNDELKLIKSSSGRIHMDKSIYYQADSIFISHSFYKNVFDLTKIKGKTYYMEVAIALDDIVLKNPVSLIIEPKGRKVDGLCNRCRMSISIPANELKNKTIKGIEFYFPKGKYHSYFGGRRVESKNKEIEIFMSFTNQKDTIYPNNSFLFVKDTLQVKKNYWNYYDLRKYNMNVGDAERIFISILTLDDMVLGRRIMKKDDEDIIYLERRNKKRELIYFLDSRLFNSALSDISLLYKIHYYDD